ncbi:MAG: hypothetical protein HC896_18375 [Bacteroidales bacterium]|nr:hypothetical protein [Bacteroidales bacterium]
MTSLPARQPAGREALFYTIKNKHRIKMGWTAWRGFLLAAPEGIPLYRLSWGAMAKTSISIKYQFKRIEVFGGAGACAVIF